MMEIKLSKGLCTMVDDSDYSNLFGYKWLLRCGRNGNYYVFRHQVRGEYSGSSKNRKVVSLHRQIMNVHDSNTLIDHIDGNGLNNTRANLRIANRSQNGCNRRSTCGT